MATNFLARVKSRPRFALAILFVGACAYAIDGWFFTQVNRQEMDWIELPDYHQAMKELQRQSVIWGDVALVLGIVAFALILPPWPTRSTIGATHGILSATPEENIWTKYFVQFVFRAGIIFVGTFGRAVMIPFASHFLHRFLDSW